MKRWLTGCLLALLLLPTPALAAAAAVTSTDLIENGAALDGQTVVYTGEVIGDILRRGDYAWLNVSDGANAIGVWVEADMLGAVSSVGRYGQTGDVVQITGVFHRACAAHGGDMDIHADQIVLRQAGQVRSHAAAGWQAVAAIILAALDGFLLAVYLRRRVRRA